MRQLQYKMKIGMNNSQKGQNIDLYKYAIIKFMSHTDSEPLSNVQKARLVVVLYGGALESIQSPLLGIGSSQEILFSLFLIYFF